MKITTKEDAVTIRRTIRLDDAEPIPYSPNTAGAPFRPTLLELTYTWSIAADGWEAPLWSGIAIAGPTVLKSGLNGWLWRRDRPPVDWRTNGDWEWLVELVELLRPFGVPTMKTLDGLEVQQ